MLALRLGLGTHPLVLLRRLLVAAASAGVGFLLLCTLGWALDHPAGSQARLLWCLIPLAATVQFAVATARTDQSTVPRTGLSAVGLGPARLAALAASSTAVSCTLGSAVALLFFLHLRGDLTGMPFDGEAAKLLAAGRPLPLGAALTLLAAVPVLATAATWLALRTRTTTDLRPVPVRAPARPANATAVTADSATDADMDRASDSTSDADSDTASGTASGTDDPADPAKALGAAVNEARAMTPVRVPDPASAPAGLPWGVAITTVGLAVETYASRGRGGNPLPLPGHFEGSSAGVLAGWALTAVGLALAGPGITHICGWLLQAVRPGAIRLLAGRTLMAEARRIGRPLGVLCAVVSGAFAAASLYGPGDERPFGPLTGLGAALVIGCAAATVLTAALESRQARVSTTESMYRLGAPATLLRTAAAVRATTILLVFAPLTWAVAALAAVPLTT
ncbi:hypothetical protein OIE62_30495 [Streptomyces scopuliridis]|uniref:Uncharacterized protein n=1 Tax=Streptomyces scopuliridis TaxID=452529 RepID=A0ACD4ZGI3_9ACTN|nr:hypothetical protein [Streptomyces scopuliridis]WSB33132.1 hypothetical protein OG949_09810 [Streptomyces scopuliridis]WSB97390.1 hypothetical protein OG835_10440 [Streptomyces scopuliridis]WSC08907.1 hypothetical protein OIE62_30495 [Streptomyces scopuliridis]